MVTVSIKIFSMRLLARFMLSTPFCIPLLLDCISPTVSFMFCVVWSASFEISSEATANPFTASPALAGSIAAFRKAGLFCRRYHLSAS